MDLFKCNVRYVSGYLGSIGQKSSDMQFKPEPANPFVVWLSQIEDNTGDVGYSDALRDSPSSAHYVSDNGTFHFIYFFFVFFLFFQYWT